MTLDPAEGPGAEPGAASIGTRLEVEGLYKEFRRRGGETFAAVDEVSFAVADAEILVLLGPSGCGKTTLLRMIAGLEQPDRGRIVVDGQEVLSEHLKLPPEKRPVGMIFQSYALWPHMTVFENVAYPLRSRRADRQEIPDRVMKVLEALGIPDLAQQHPGTLSGGQQQRVALARAIVPGDRVILFDEPLSNVDAKVRERLRLELLTMQADLGFSAVYVTHDQEEAMELGHRVAVMDAGKFRQLAPPQEIYDHPGSRFVASFVGSANEVSGEVETVERDRVWVTTEFGRLDAHLGEDGLSVGDDVVVIFRPEKASLHLEEPGSAASLAVRAEIVSELYQGRNVDYVVSVGDRRFRVSLDEPLPRSHGGCWLSLPGQKWLTALRR